MQLGHNSLSLALPSSATINLLLSERNRFGPDYLADPRPGATVSTDPEHEGGDSVKLGVTIWFTEYTIGPAELAVAVEERGFESMLLPDHTNIPVSRRTPFPGGGELPREYSHLLDPFVALAVAAAVTKRIKLGPGVCLLMERDPIATAKAMASLDQVSGGRALFGVGGGWNLEEMENHGTDPRTRFRLLRERVGAIRSLWTDEVAHYEGSLVKVEPTWQWPKPLQPGGIPILVGGNGPGVIDRVLEYGDEWLPAMALTERALADDIALLQSKAAAAGRDRIPVTVYGAPPQQLGALEEAGVDRVILGLPPAGADEVLKALDQLAANVA
ncbi:MAG: LLM class F420-dependent oxidoreductase [Acidimicrobiales bacterium]|nr:LLM class F420-dependent oxidoreductase [Acidimicrobiales bacterium]